LKHPKVPPNSRDKDCSDGAKKIAQGLKPYTFYFGINGTAEAMPLQNMSFPQHVK
jgi:hypothetical protein